MAFDIPADLVQLQREWFAAETRWQEAAQRGDQPAIDEEYLATQRLTLELHRHPWMQASGQRYEALWRFVRPHVSRRRVATAEYANARNHSFLPQRSWCGRPLLAPWTTTHNRALTGRGDETPQSRLDPAVLTGTERYPTDVIRQLLSSERGHLSCHPGLTSRSLARSRRRSSNTRSNVRLWGSASKTKRPSAGCAPSPPAPGRHPPATPATLSWTNSARPQLVVPT